MTELIGVEVDCPFTPGVLKKVVYAGTISTSFKGGADDLEALAELNISAGRIERWTKRVGQERVGEVESRAEVYEALPLPEQRRSPTAQVPAIACVQMDGGRIQIRERAAAHEASCAAAGQGHWRETLVGCLLSMTGEAQAEDPCPHLPESFADPQRMSQLSREIKGVSAEPPATAETPEDAPAERPQRPRMLVKSVVATRRGLETFGWRLAAAAHARGFSGAGRKAFVADGAQGNWSIHRQHFSHYTPILDFTHAVCYVWLAATAGRTDEAAWTDYLQWAQWLLAGQNGLPSGSDRQPLPHVGVARRRR